MADHVLEIVKEFISQNEIDANSSMLQKKFSFIYENNLWSSTESVSGRGSEISYTTNLRSMLPKIVEQFGINKIFDAPCGDFNWMKVFLSQNPIRYLGADIVPELINQNNTLYSNEDVKFMTLDITKNSLPDADLMICRDCLFHLSIENIRKFIDNYLKSNIPYLLTTTHRNLTKFVNIDIPDGDFRLLDLMIEPFNFPVKPLSVIEDWVVGYPERTMCLWSKEQILNSREISNL